MILPQNAYLLPLASLRAQVCYPLVPAASSEVAEKLGQAPLSLSSVGALLAEVGMPSHAVQRLLERCGGIDTVRSDWGQLLAPGQRQLLACARLCYHADTASVRLAVLDEGTASLDAKAEQAAYAALRARKLAVLSVGHRRSLIPLHDSVVYLE